MSVASAITLNGHRVFLFLYNFKVNCGNVGFICLAAQTWLKSNPVSKSFLLCKSP